MAFSKADQYAQDEQMVSKYCRSIMHPARQRILKQLKKEGVLTVEEIGKGHPIMPSTVSNHIGMLSAPPLISGNEQYPYTYYNVNVEEVERARKAINNFFDSLLGPGLSG